MTNLLAISTLLLHTNSIANEMSVEMRRGRFGRGWGGRGGRRGERRERRESALSKERACLCVNRKSGSNGLL